MGDLKFLRRLSVLIVSSPPKLRGYDVRFAAGAVARNLQGIVLQPTNRVGYIERLAQID